MSRPAALDAAFDQLDKLEKQRAALLKALGSHAPNKAGGPGYDDRERSRKAKFAFDRTKESNHVEIRPRAAEWQERWERYRYDLKGFLTECFPYSTSMRPFGDQQLHAIDVTQEIIIKGGRFCDAEPRGFVKTTRIANSAIWALAYGHRKCIPIFGSNKGKAIQLLNIIKVNLTQNDCLAQLFPFAVDCFRAIKNRTHRTAHQHSGGKPTGIAWKSDTLTFPTMLEADCYSGSLIVQPISNARGLVISNDVTGEVYRPDFVFLDDIQLDAIAKSERRIEDLVELIRHEVLRLAGHDKTLSAVMTITCRRAGDVAEAFLADPSWMGVRNKMLITRADKEKEFWLGPYADLRRNYDPDDKLGQAEAHAKATQLYLDNRELADAGCQPGWDWAYAWNDQPQREHSAVQHAYNILIDDGEAAFMSECQNEPSVAGDLENTNLTVKLIKNKKAMSGHRVVPNGARKIIAGIDVQERAIFWSVTALGDNMTGTVIDYGVIPEQSTLDFSYENMAHNLVTQYPDEQPGGRIYRGLEEVVSRLMAREWIREDGTIMAMNRVLIDRGYQTDAVDFFIRSSQWRSTVMGSMGFGVEAKDTPFGSRVKQEHDQKGDNWIVRPIANDKNQRIARMLYCMIDTNFWKSVMRNGFRLGFGNEGCLSMYNAPQEDWHLGFSRHLCAEYSTETFGRGRWVDEWEARPGRPDNHWLDCTVMCLVGGSIEGINRKHSLFKMKPTVTARFVSMK